MIWQDCYFNNLRNANLFQQLAKDLGYQTTGINTLLISVSVYCTAEDKAALAEMFCEIYKDLIDQQFRE